MPMEPHNLLSPQVKQEIADIFRACEEDTPRTMSICQLGWALQEQYHAAYALPVASGTAALLAALRVLHITGPQDEVICPINGYPAMVNAIVAAGATPVFCDVGDDLVLSAEAAAPWITSRTRAILMMQRFGFPGDPAAFRALRDAHSGLRVIIDARQAYLPYAKSHLDLASCTDAVILSFGKDGIINAGGGGALLTNDAELSSAAANFIRHGSSQTPFFQQFGLNCTISELQALLILALLSSYEDRYSKRMGRAQVILRALQPLGYKPVPSFNEAPNACHRLILQLPDAVEDPRRFISRVNSGGVLMRQAFPMLLNEYCAQQGLRCRSVPDGSLFPNASKHKERYVAILVDSRSGPDMVERLRRQSAALLNLPLNQTNDGAAK